MRALIVEDERIQSHLMKKLLSEQNELEVEVARNGEDALLRVKDETIDLLVCDIELPGISGFRVVEEVKHRSPNTIVVVVTSHADSTYADAAVRAGVDAFLVKPIRRTELVERVTELLAGRAPEPKRVQGNTVLAVGVGTDAIESGCSGSLLVHADQGDRLVMVVVTRYGKEEEETIFRAKSVADQLGSDLHFVHGNDDESEMMARLQGELATIISRYRPTTVYTHSVTDTDAKHGVVYDATLAASTEIPNVYCYESGYSTTAFDPKKFVDIDRFIDKKLDALVGVTFDSPTNRNVEPDMVRAAARYWSRHSDARFVEALEVVRNDSNPIC